MTDKNGVIIEKAEDGLVFDIQNGTLIGVDNGDSCCLLPFKRTHVKLHRGRAMITARFETEGKIEITTGTLQKAFTIR